MPLGPEDAARENIDELLEKAGWVVQDYAMMNLGESLGVAVTFFPIGRIEADYVLFVDRKPVGVIEAKPEGHTLSAVNYQTEKYTAGLKDLFDHIEDVPFQYESTGVETYFRDTRDPHSRSRKVFAFHQPEVLRDWYSDDKTLRARLKEMPELDMPYLWGCQEEAVESLEKSLAKNKPRSLVQMATGSGKTFTAISTCYRLIKHAKANRVLFLVDRSNLGDQTEKEFQQYVTPDGRKFTELYNVQHMETNSIDKVSKVCISTIQRMYSMLKGDPEMDAELEQESDFEKSLVNTDPVEVVYNSDIPIETFDFIIIDECHRSIYNLWRQVLEYFDAFQIGLTATPSKQTIGYFNKNLVMEYPHERAVADGVNVNYDVYKIRTKITEEGSSVEEGNWITIRDKKTRREKHEELEDELEYSSTELDRKVVAPDQIRTIIRTFKNKLFTELFPGRQEVPKTLVFAKDDHHAEEIVHIIREEFNKGNDFCKKITYKVTGEDPKDIIKEFRNSYNPRIAVSVDMVSTGTDVKPIECLLFMRLVKSRNYFEQMKGRGTRVINKDDLKAVTPDAEEKTHFILVDTVGVVEQEDKTDSKPLERKRTVSFDKLVKGVAKGFRDEDTLTSLANRLSRFQQSLEEDELEELKDANGGEPLRKVINGLLDAVDKDLHIEKAQEQFDTSEPTEKQIKQVRNELIEEGCAPLDNPEFRNKVLEIKERSLITIDPVSLDEEVEAGFSDNRARELVQSFQEFIEDNKDEITALQIFYNQPFGKRHLTLEQIRELADAIKQPPYKLTEKRLWEAYKQLEKSKVEGASDKRLMTDLISLIRHAMGESEELEPFEKTIEEQFYSWLRRQEQSGKQFTSEQLEWLELIKTQIATSLNVELEDLEYPPFQEKGGPVKAIKLFGREELKNVMDELNKELAA